MGWTSVGVQKVAELAGTEGRGSTAVITDTATLCPVFPLLDRKKKW